MKKMAFIVFFLVLIALSGVGQNRLLQTKTAPKSIQAFLFTPGNPTPDVVDLTVESQVPQKDWQWMVKDGCLEYKTGNQDTTFCGTFKIVRTYE
jgi:hypothetical protein